MNVIIFDLDETLIDSKHRTPRNPDGTVNLAYYMAHATRENIFKDTLLPLAKEAQRIFAEGKHYVIFCTARHMHAADYDFLAAHNLKAHRIFSRDKAREFHYKMRDAAYKTQWLKPLLNLRQFRNRQFFMIDDEKKVISALRKCGIITLNAIRVNQRISKNG